MAEEAIIPQDTNIDSILQEQRRFECAPEFAKQALVKSLAEYERLYKESVEQPEKFWARAAEELLWFKKLDKVLEGVALWAKWFVGGQHNLSYHSSERPELTFTNNNAD